MIKEIDEIPVLAKPKSRASTIREDIKEAFGKRISKFEFVGGVYNTCKNYAPQVREEASRYFFRYFENEVAQRMGTDDVRPVYSRTFDRAYKVYRQNDDKGIVHVYMEIHYDQFESIIRDWINVLQKGKR